MKDEENSTERRATLLERILRFPLTRIVLGTLFVGVAVSAALLIIGLLEQGFGLRAPLPALFDLFEVILAALAAYLGYFAYVHFIEHRPMTELSGRGAIGGLGLGLLLGVGLSGLVMGILWLLGDYHVTGINTLSVVIVTLVSDLPSAFVQQLILVGVLFRITEQALGKWWALLITVVVFGLVHVISVPNLTLLELAGILLAGLVFATSYVLTRRLWVPIGLHVAWSVMFDGIFGVGTEGTSGVAIKGLFQAHLSGPSLLTGGAMGAEGSLVSIVLLLVVATLFIVRATRVPVAGDPIPGSPETKDLER